jgi:hypothetical protein
MVTPEDRVIKAAGALARALDNRMPPHMSEFTIKALSDLQDVSQQTAINYNVNPATHVIPAAPPKVPPNKLPEPTSPDTSPRVGIIALSPQPSLLLSTHRTINNPRVHDIPKTTVVLTRLDFLDDSLSLQQVSLWQSPWPNPPEVQAPSLPLNQPHLSQQIASTRHPVDDDAPACNT